MTTLMLIFKNRNFATLQFKNREKIVDLEFVKTCDELIHCKENGCKSAPRDQPEKNVHSGFVQTVLFVD